MQFSHHCTQEVIGPVHAWTLLSVCLIVVEVIPGQFCVRSAYVTSRVHKMADEKWSIEKLTSENWVTWKFQMKHLLLVKDLWNITQGTETLAQGADDAARAAFDVRCQKAFSILVMSIDPSQLYLITSCDNPKQAWGNLKQQFESDTLHNKLLLKKQYFRLEMSEGSSMEKHLV